MKIPISRNQLKTLYKNLDTSKIAEMYHVSCYKIRLWIKQLNIPIRPKGNRKGNYVISIQKAKSNAKLWGFTYFDSDNDWKGTRHKYNWKCIKHNEVYPCLYSSLQSGQGLRCCGLDRTYLLIKEKDVFKRYKKSNLELLETYKHSKIKHKTLCHNFCEKQNGKGNIFYTTPQAVFAKNTTSCGCVHRELAKKQCREIIAVPLSLKEVQGRLKRKNLELLESYNGCRRKHKLMCHRFCEEKNGKGNIFYASLNNVFSGSTSSCGCITIENRKNTITKRRNKQRPSKKILQKLYNKMGMEEIAKIYKTSDDKTVRRWFTEYNIPLKPRGWGVKLSMNRVKKIAKNLGFIFMDEEFKGTIYKHNWKCITHSTKIKDEIYMAQFANIQQGWGLKCCKRASQREVFGSKHPNWDHSKSLKDRLDNVDQRHANRPWANFVKQRDDFKCLICNSNKHLHAHHLEDWNNNQKLRNDHKNGVTICETHHRRFHNFYGNDGNSLDDFMEFFF